MLVWVNIRAESVQFAVLVGVEVLIHRFDECAITSAVDRGKCISHPICLGAKCSDGFFVVSGLHRVVLLQRVKFTTILSKLWLVRPGVEVVKRLYKPVVVLDGSICGSAICFRRVVLEFFDCGDIRIAEFILNL